MLAQSAVHCACLLCKNAPPGGLRRHDAPLRVGADLQARGAHHSLPSGRHRCATAQQHVVKSGPPRSERPDLGKPTRSERSDLGKPTRSERPDLGKPTRSERSDLGGPTRSERSDLNKPTRSERSDLGGPAPPGAMGGNTKQTHRVRS